MQPQLTNSGGFSQATTASPQTAGQGSLSSLAPGGIQSSNSINLLNNTSGIRLTPNNLPSVTVNSSQKTSTTEATPITKHHTNGLLIGLAILLFVVAALMIGAIVSTANNTTE